MSSNGLLIDWITLRVPLDGLTKNVSDRVRECMGHVVCCDADGVVKWKQNRLDVDKLRSDAPGLFWAAQGDGRRDYLVIAGSPASIAHGQNVFGSLDIRSGAEVLRQTAQKALGAFLPPIDFMQCRRIDITGNYALPDAGSVKQALRQLLNTDGVRRKAGSDKKKKSDTVYWNATSDLTKGKAYHKGPHLRDVARKRGVPLSEDQLQLADRLLRLEHTRGSRFFRRMEEAGREWFSLTAQELAQMFREFFGPLVEGLEVKKMTENTIKDAIITGAHVKPGAADRAFSEKVAWSTHRPSYPGNSDLMSRQERPTAHSVAPRGLGGGCFHNAEGKR